MQDRVNEVCIHVFGALKDSQWNGPLKPDCIRFYFEPLVDFNEAKPFCVLQEMTLDLFLSAHRTNLIIFIFIWYDCKKSGKMWTLELV